MEDILDLERPGFKRATASDRPGVAQPVPERHIPARDWPKIQLGAFLLFALLLGAWEFHWRAFGANVCCRGDDAAWAAQRRRIDHGEGGGLVLLGSSRTLYDLNLDVWQATTGERPIQLALAGTTPVPFLEDLAGDPNFTGRLVVGVAPDLFFSGFAGQISALDYFRKERPSQRVGDWLSLHLIQPFFAFYDEDFALEAVLARQDWPVWFGAKRRPPVRKLSVSDADRNTHLWDKVTNDPDYRAIVRARWLLHLDGPPDPDMDTPEKAKAVIDAQIAKAKAAVEKLRARGVRIVFLRLPATGHYLEVEQRDFPRDTTWDRLLTETATEGIHFEDVPDMQGYDLPEWSHLSASEAVRITPVVAQLATQRLADAGQPR